MNENLESGIRHPNSGDPHTRERRAAGTTEATAARPSPASCGGVDSLQRLSLATRQRLREDETARSRPSMSSSYLFPTRSSSSSSPSPQHRMAMTQPERRNEGSVVLPMLNRKKRRSLGVAPISFSSVLETVFYPAALPRVPQHRSEPSEKTTVRGAPQRPAGATKATRDAHEPKWTFRSQRQRSEQGWSPASTSGSMMASRTGRSSRKGSPHDDDHYGEGDSSSSDADNATPVSAKNCSLSWPATRHKVVQVATARKPGETDNCPHSSRANEHWHSSPSRDKPGVSTDSRPDPRDLCHEPHSGPYSSHEDSSIFSVARVKKQNPACSLKKQTSVASKSCQSPREEQEPSKPSAGTTIPFAGPSREDAAAAGVVPQRRGTPRKARGLLALPKWTEAVVPAQILFNEIARYRQVRGKDRVLDPDADRVLDEWHAGVARRLCIQNRLVLRNIDTVHREKLVKRHVDRIRADLVEQRRTIRDGKRQVRLAKRKIEDWKVQNGKRRTASRFLSALDKLRR